MVDFNFPRPPHRRIYENLDKLRTFALFTERSIKIEERAMEHKKMRSRDSEATRSAALDTAQHLFAEKGFAGTTMREIASCSGVSQPLIHYHFGSKDGLYSAVKERLMQEGLRSFLHIHDGSPDAADPSVLIRSTFHFISGSEDLMRLIAWSHLEREDTPWPGEQELTHLVTGYIRRHMSDTPRVKDIDPFIATIMIQALILFWGQFSCYYASLFKTPISAVTERYLDQIALLFFPHHNSNDKE